MEAALLVQLASALIPLGQDVARTIHAWQVAEIISETDAMAAMQLRRKQMNDELALLDKLGVQVTSGGGS